LYTQTAKKLALKGDILLSVRAPVGDLNIADQEYGIGRGLCAVQPLEGTYRNFLRYFLEVGKNELLSIATGSTYEAVSISQVANMQCILPPIEEQKSIARFLDRETTRIDTLITKKRQLIALLQKRRFSEVIHAVSKGLDPKVDMKDSNVFWLEKVPKHWGLCQLKFACVLQRGFDLPSQERQEGEVPIYGGGGISGYHNQAMIQPPGVVTGRYGTVGEVYFIEEPFWPLNTSLYVKAFWENSPKYIHYLLSALPIDIYAGKSAVPGVDRNDLHTIPVPIPPKEEQDEIVKHIDQIDEYQSKLTQIIENQLKEIKKHRSVLITSAVTGKIDVREEVH
jgi:type I restriction enzyme S subunit